MWLKIILHQKYFDGNAMDDNILDHFLLSLKLLAMWQETLKWLDSPLPRPYVFRFSSPIQRQNAGHFAIRPGS